MRTFLFLTLNIALLLQAGCGPNDGRPADMPKLYPVQVSIIQDGKPLGKADITLTIKIPLNNYGTATGFTDASGIAILRTYGYDGVPVGQYTVAVSKRTIEGATLATSEDGATYETGGTIYQTVDVQFTDTAQSPLSIDVTEKGATESFDVGAPVRVSLGQNTL